MPDITIAVDKEMLARLEVYRRQQDVGALEEALRCLILTLPLPPEWNEARHAAVMERLELSQRRARQAIINRAKCEGAW